jgi:ABC-type antimicrobial peptide transport system permease subunit
MKLCGAGVVIGIAGAAAATSLMTSMLFGISRLDPVTYGGVIVLLSGVALMACAMPAWRAARVDPASSLRAD